MEFHNLAGHLFDSLYLADGESLAEDDADGMSSPGRRLLDMAFVAGYMLKTKTTGWKLFCDRLCVPPFLLWETLPGYDRLERAWKTAEHVAFAVTSSACPSMRQPT
jgi:hypothetical protein